MDKPIELHNTPQFYVEYMKGWVARKKKENSNPAELVVVQDICTLVELAASFMKPKPECEIEVKQR